MLFSTQLVREREMADERRSRVMGQTRNGASYVQPRPAYAYADLTGKAMRRSAREEPLIPITGNGGAGAGSASKPATKAAPSPTAKPATPPKLTKTNVEGPTAYDCGAFKWVVQWKLDKPTTVGGWVVQKVSVKRDVKDCAGKVKSASDVGGLDPSWYPVWEAWQIHKDQKVTTYAETGDTADDSFGSTSLADTKGTLAITGRPEFYEGLTLPTSFTATNAAPTWILPATKSAPSLKGGTGAISHSLTAKWDCCTADKTTKAVDKTTKLTTA